MIFWYVIIAEQYFSCTECKGEINGGDIAFAANADPQGGIILPTLCLQCMEKRFPGAVKRLVRDDEL